MNAHSLCAVPRLLRHCLRRKGMFVTSKRNRAFSAHTELKPTAEIDRTKTPPLPVLNVSIAPKYSSSQISLVEEPTG